MSLKPNDRFPSPSLFSWRKHMKYQTMCTWPGEHSTLPARSSHIFPVYPSSYFPCDSQWSQYHQFWNGQNSGQGIQWITHLKMQFIVHEHNLNTAVTHRDQHPYNNFPSRICAPFLAANSGPLVVWLFPPSSWGLCFVGQQPCTVLFRPCCWSVPHFPPCWTLLLLGHCVYQWLRPSIGRRCRHHHHCHHRLPESPSCP